MKNSRRLSLLLFLLFLFSPFSTPAQVYTSSLEKDKILCLAEGAVIQEKIFSLDNWEKVDEEKDIDIAEFYFRHKSEKWDSIRRYFVVRHRKRAGKPEAVGKQLSFFPDTEIIAGLPEASM